MAIDKDSAAQRLARAIFADVVLYNQPKLKDGGEPRAVFAPDIEEGRQLFRERVAPAFHSVFERELAAFDFSVAQKRPGTGSIAPLLMVVVTVVLGAVAYVYLSR